MYDIINRRVAHNKKMQFLYLKNKGEDYFELYQKGNKKIGLQGLLHGWQPEHNGYKQFLWTARI